MNNIQDIFSVVKQLSEAINIPALQTEIQNLTRLRATLQTNPQVGLSQANAIIDKIIAMVVQIDNSLWTVEQEYVAEKLEISNLIGEKGRHYLENVKIQLQSNPSNSASVIQLLTAELNKLKTKPNQFLTLLQPFELNPNVKLINREEGIIEIIFDGDVAIDDFKEAKHQMADWFLIIEGYARLLNVRREDFEIISISKNSPAKFKIKTSLTNVTLVLSIISSVLVIEKNVLENRLMIERLKQNALIPDQETQTRFIEDAEKHIDAVIKDGINKIVEQKLSEHNMNEGNGDVKNNIAKGVEIQYNFIVNGGNVNIHVLDGQIAKQVDVLEKTKNELKQIKQSYEAQKLITTGDKE